ncbi:unnamed protein product [Bursaphelenchus okinawaensis]|uniref:Uncharacterized protein n=1 Tax=Bursaphelenchus okinawaensis TaxID=465554 RepID=A0A811JVE5_9BILA|nr:unnamed protein product [Bursaphelenchus okinawaensis]CAG9085477.1 unnamed protein product [Bursaphelenchus okinawaensis]
MSDHEEVEELEEETYEMEDLAEPSMEVTNEFVELFREFDPDIDGLLLEKAWKQYDQIKQQVLLEGNEKVWMVCSFYTNSFQATPYGQDPVYTYSLLKLLRTCNVSVLEFFVKLGKWLNMISASRRLVDHATRVEASLSVSTVIYKKYLKIFRAVFRIHSARTSSQTVENIGTAELFEFIWTALIALKKCLPVGTDDLLSSYHILISLVEICFSELRNVESPVLNPEFVKLMDSEDSPLEFICRQFDGVELDAKHLRVHWLLPVFTELATKGTLLLPTLDKRQPVELLNAIEHNKTKLNELYETQMLKRMEVDERVFISHVVDNVDMVFNESLDDSAITILRRCNLNSQWAVDADLLLRMSTQSCLQKVQLQAKPLNTPLSARSYIISSEQFVPVTPVSAASYKAQKLAELTAQDYKNSDGEFDRLLNHSSENLKAYINDTVEHLENLISRRCDDEAATFGQEFDSSFSNQLQQRLVQVEQLFYRFLQATIMYDRARNPRADSEELAAILRKQDFIYGLYTAAFELVANSYDSQRGFPWSVKTIGMAPINFYKIIEVVIRADPELTREMVKHLNRCEEKVLDELAWQPDSPIWQAIQKREIPPCDQLLQDLTGSQPVHTRYVASPMKLPQAVKRKMEFSDDLAIPTKKGTDEVGPPSGIGLFFRKFYYLAAVRLTDLADRIRLDEAARNKVWTLFEHVIRHNTNLMSGRHLDQNLMCCIYIVARVVNMETSFQVIIQHYRNQPQSSSRVYRNVRVDSGYPKSTVMDEASRDSIQSTASAQNSNLQRENQNQGQNIHREGQNQNQGQNTHRENQNQGRDQAPDSGHGSQNSLHGSTNSNGPWPTSLAPCSNSNGPWPSSSSQTPEPQEYHHVDLIKYYNTVFIPKVEDFVKKMQPETKENQIEVSAMPKVVCTTLSPRRMISEQLAVIPMSAFSQNPRRQFAVQTVPQSIRTQAIPQTIRPF